MTTETFNHYATVVTFNFEHRANRTAKGTVTCADDEITCTAEFTVNHTANIRGARGEHYIVTYVLNGKTHTFNAVVWDEVERELTGAVYRGH
jgi:hypothetical protein